MNIRNITLALTALVTSVCLAATASAQNFIPVEYGPENYGGTHADAMRVLGAPAPHRGNEGLPMVDTYSSQPNNNMGIPWRGDTIFTPEQRTSYYNYQPYNGQFNTAQLQASIQNFQRAVQQVRANRQYQQQLYWQQQQQQQYYNHQHHNHWGWR